MTTDDGKSTGREPIEPSAEVEKNSGREADQLVIPTDKRRMSLMERIVYVKTWSKTYRSFILWLPDWITPNAVTFFRAALIAPIFWALRTESYWWALGFFAFATALDSVDGAVAHVKRMNSTSGAFYDPLADKVLICGALFAVIDKVPPWMVALTWGTLTVAVGITVTRLWKMAMKRRQGQATHVSVIAAKPVGKMKMIFDVAAVSLIVIGLGLALDLVVMAGGGLMTIAFGFACMSFFSQLAE